MAKISEKRGKASNAEKIPPRKNESSEITRKVFIQLLFDYINISSNGLNHNGVKKQNGKEEKEEEEINFLFGGSLPPNIIFLLPDS